MVLPFFSRPQQACATCGTPLDRKAIAAHGRLFHSILCLRRFEKERSMEKRQKRRRESGGSCSTCPH